MKRHLGQKKVSLGRLYRQHFYERILHRAPGFVEVYQELGKLYYQEGLHQKALRIHHLWRQARPEDPLVYYYLACDYSVLSDLPRALACLEIALILGYRHQAGLEKNPALTNLRHHPRYQILLQRFFQSPAKR
ncbi:MAG: hypothetical protein NC911_01630 [Candidatus Omnitrophica bacterium]|nr:hypothetical protein [Candidatus Omnitrophota bacterium]